MNRVRLIAAASAACLPMLLGGCSVFHSHPAPMVSNNDVPEAGMLDAKRSQALFLAVIGGLRDQGQSRAALAYLDAFDKEHPGVPDAQLLRAECLMDIGQADRAKPVYAALLKGPYAAAANAGLGSVAATHDDWKHALGSFLEASRLAPSQAQYANDLGFAEVKLGDFNGGIDMLGRASELAPDNRFIRNNLILGLHLSGQDSQAARVIDGIAEPNERRDAQKLLLVPASALAMPTALHGEPEKPAQPAKKLVADAAKPTPAKSTDKEIKS